MNRPNTILQSLGAALAGLFGVRVGRPAVGMDAPPDPADDPFGSEFGADELPDGTLVVYGRGVARTAEAATDYLAWPPGPGFERRCAETARVAHGVSWQFLDVRRP